MGVASEGSSGALTWHPELYTGIPVSLPWDSALWLVVMAHCWVFTHTGVSSSAVSLVGEPRYLPVKQAPEYLSPKQLSEGAAQSRGTGCPQALHGCRSSCLPSSASLTLPVAAGSSPV